MREALSKVKAASLNRFPPQRNRIDADLHLIHTRFVMVFLNVHS